MSDKKTNDLDEQDVKLLPYKSVVKALPQDKALAMATECEHAVPDEHPSGIDEFADALDDQAQVYTDEKNTPKDNKDKTATEDSSVSDASNVLTAIKNAFSSTSTRLRVEKNLSDKQNVDTGIKKLALVSLAVGSKTDKKAAAKKVKQLMNKLDASLFEITNTATLKEELLTLIDTFLTTAKAKENAQTANAQKNKTENTYLKDNLLGFLGALEPLRNKCKRNTDQGKADRIAYNSIIRAVNPIITKYKG